MEENTERLVKNLENNSPKPRRGKKQYSYGSENNEAPGEIVIEAKTFKKEPGFIDYSCDDEEFLLEPISQDIVNIKQEQEEESSYEYKERSQWFANKTSLSHKCVECELEFSSRKELCKHVKKFHEEEKQFKCNFCGKILKTNLNLKLHIESIHKNQKFKCTECSKSFTYKSAMYRHREQEHRKGKRYQCSKCPQKVGTIHELMLHNQRYHNNNRKEVKKDPESTQTNCVVVKQEPEEEQDEIIILYDLLNEKEKEQLMCNICGKVLMSDRNLRLHIQAIHNNQKFECTECSKSFTYKSAMYRHRCREHRKGKVYQCDKCPQKVDTKHELMVHNVRLHNNKLKSDKSEHMCIYCGIYFPSAYLIEKHMIESQKDHDLFKNPAVCDFCSKTFEKLTTLESHLKDHLKSKEEMSFGECYAQNNDSKIENDAEAPTKIEIDAITFKDEPEFVDIKNVDAKHEQREEFGQDGNIFLHDLLDEKFYEEKEQFKCNLCGKVLMSDRNLKLHIQAIHNNQRFECTVCSKSFSYKSAMYRHRDREHGKGKVYQCDKCPQKVGTKHELMLHNERHHDNMRQSGKPEHMCTYCGICFPSAFVMSLHKKRIHRVDE